MAAARGLAQSSFAAPAAERVAISGLLRRVPGRQQASPQLQQALLAQQRAVRLFSWVDLRGELSWPLRLSCGRVSPFSSQLTLSAVCARLLCANASPGPSWPIGCAQSCAELSSFSPSACPPTAVRATLRPPIPHGQPPARLPRRYSILIAAPDPRVHGADQWECLIRSSATAMAGRPPFARRWRPPRSTSWGAGSWTGLRVTSHRRLVRTRSGGDAALRFPRFADLAKRCNGLFCERSTRPRG
jgi:hypothetical protein